jgi:hypothetical protein
MFGAPDLGLSAPWTRPVQTDRTARAAWIPSEWPIRQVNQPACTMPPTRPHVASSAPCPRRQSGNRPSHQRSAPEIVDQLSVPNDLIGCDSIEHDERPAYAPSAASRLRQPPTQPAPSAPSGSSQATDRPASVRAVGGSTRQPVASRASDQALVRPVTPLAAYSCPCRSPSPQFPGIRALWTIESGVSHAVVHRVRGFPCSGSPSPLFPMPSFIESGVLHLALFRFAWSALCLRVRLRAKPRTRYPGPWKTADSMTRAAQNPGLDAQDHGKQRTR